MKVVLGSVGRESYALVREQAGACHEQQCVVGEQGYILVHCEKQLKRSISEKYFNLQFIVFYGYDKWQSFI
ncbi:MAG: hypothetical protein AAF847_19880, partial [Bacteroidota bacterium]